MEASDGGRAPIWKFGYGSNISPEYLRTKKQLTVLDCRRCVLKGFVLSFPLGRGIDLVEPSWAALRREAGGEVHGTVCLLPADDAAALDRQEGGYIVEVHRVFCYGDGSAGGARDTGAETTLAAEVYTPHSLEPQGCPQGACSVRYREILLRGAVEMALDAAWVDKLRSLPVYTPSAETLALREKLPPPESLPQWTCERLALHNGEREESHPAHVSSCGYVFAHRARFKAQRGRDVTFRFTLHRRHTNMDANDTDPHGRDVHTGRFPVLAELEPHVLEYTQMYCDRFHAKSGLPIGALTEFWQDQQRPTEADSAQL